MARKKKWTDETIIAEIRRVMEVLSISDRLPSAREIRAHSTCYDSINKSGGLKRYSKILNLPTAGSALSIFFRKTCVICGKEFTTRYRPARMCSKACRYRSYLLNDRSATKPEPKRKDIRTMRDIRPSRADQIERELQKQNLHYRDHQMAETLKMVGGVRVIEIMEVEHAESI